MQTDITPPPARDDLLRRLLHRWFIEYNPLYVLSAVLVLFGLTLISRALAEDASIWGHVVVDSVTELYAAALIGGAALLTRIGLRRPAVFVALIAVLYQGDLALGTETYALFGHVGELASVTWLVVFVAKLHALAWALKLRLSFSAAAVPSLGAIGLVVIPQLSRRVGTHALSMAVGLWLFAVLAAALWTSRIVTSRTPLDAWGRTVLRRSMLATWTIWGAFAIAHVLFWQSHFHLHPALFVPIVCLLATRWVRGELAVLAIVSVTLLFVGATLPELFPLTALTSACVLSLHALRKPMGPRAGDVAAASELYRGAPVDPVEPSVEPIFAPSPPAAMARQLAWAGYSTYLCAWSSWSGGQQHVAMLDLTALIVVALFVWRLRQRVVLLPLIASYVQWSIQSRLVRAPRSTLEWGVATVGLGFGLLLASLFTSWRLQRLATPSHDASGSVV
ncbi:MAG: hypothetical protein ACXWUG_20490 [Polyangiales bacterium]